MTCFVSNYDESDYFSSINYLESLLNDDNSEHITNLIFIQLVIAIEVFIERLSKPFIKECYEIDSNKLPKRIKIEHSKQILKSLNDKISYASKQNDCERLFNELSNVWHNKDHKFKLNFHLKFKSGKHGDDEITRIFEKIGLNDILSLIKIEDQSSDSLLSDNNYINVRLFIQELVAKRNLAIHQGIQLSSDFSISQVKGKILTVKRILQEINVILDNHLNNLKI